MCVITTVELPLSSDHSEAHNTTGPNEEGSLLETLVSLLCSIVCPAEKRDEQYSEPVGKTRIIDHHSSRY